MKRWQLYLIIAGGLLLGVYFGSGVGNIALPEFFKRFIQISGGLLVGFFIGIVFVRLLRSAKQFFKRT
jgi:NhaP-type Na+/H+ or K+/H+ antiporter